MRRLKENEILTGSFLTAGFAMLTLLIVFALNSFFPFGNGSIIAVDLNSQYTPLLYRFYDVATGAKHIAIDFHIGGGINLYSDTLTELLNPFNYCLLLFKRAYIYKAVNILLLMYVMAASVTAYIALTKVVDGLHNATRIALSLTYSLSYFVAYQYEIIRWMYIVVLFPFVFLAIKRLLEKNKPLLFCLMLAYILILSLQLGIQICIFSFVYFACYIWKSRKEKDAKHLCLVVGLSFVSALLMSAVSTLPTVINLLGSARSTQSASILTVIESHGLDNILERILEISNPVVAGLFIAFILSAGKKSWSVLKRQEEMPSLIILIVTVLLEPSNLLWHLGSYQCFPVRYAYIVLWLGIVVVAKLYSEIGGEKDTEDTVVINGVEEDSSGLVDTKSAKKPVTILGICVIVVVSLAELVFTLKNSLRFSYAFTTLEISKMKKETMLLYLLMLGIIVIATLCVTCLKKNRTIVNAMVVYLACLMGAIWFIAVLWPESMEARSTNEQNYVNLNMQYEVNKDKEFEGRIRENETQSLNSCLVSGAYSMSAYVPSGESLEYVTAMQKLGYDTPWISVSENGGSELSDKLLGIEADYAVAWLIDKEDYKTLRNISDLLDVLEAGGNQADLAEGLPSSARKIAFDNRKGSIKITSDSDMSGVLLLPMAYIDGWSSKQGTVEKYLEGLLAVDILETTKEVDITHTIPGVMYGIILGILGVLVLCVVTMISRIDSNYVNREEGAKSKPSVIRRLDIIASVCFGALSIAFIIIMYILPNIGMLVFMGAKATGNDWSPYIESRKATKESTHTLISENVTQDGIEILIGKNNLMQEKGIKIVSSDDENASFRASKIADGLVDRENRWSSSNDHDNNEHYIQVDFKEPKNIQAVNIFWERTNASHYYIEVSEDGNNWHVVSEFSMPSQTNPQIIYYEDAISARYMRLHVDEVTKNEEDLSLYYQNVSVLELEVYDDECDNFVIDRPVIDNGTNRKVPVMDVPEGYLLKVGGINYDNLLTKDGYFVDNISDVDINLGYELYYGDEKWDLSGFDITLPAAVNDTNQGNNKQAFPFKNVNVQEWLAADGNIDLTEYKAAIGEGKYCSIIDTRIDEKADYLGDEGYEIVIKNDAISVTAKTKRGLYWGSLTLKHMVAEKAELPCGIIRDYPEYSVRGFVLDVARRPIPMDELYRMLYELSDNYMNTFQIHLSDNEIIAMSDYDGTMEGAKALFSAYRLESDVQANEKTLTTQEFYYTDEEFSKFIADAKAIGVDVVPEIDTPAHALAITSIKPELGYDAAELADTLDISKSEVLDFATNLWAEYLEEDELFDECDVVHLGMDEFYGNSSDYVNYMSKLSSNIRGLAPDKTQRVWASLTYNDANTAPLNRNIEMMIWNPVWSNPKKTYEDGFKVINCLNKHLYIIVDGGNDRLDVDDLATNWEPNQFVDDECDETIPAWSPRMLGACYSMWNDNYCSNEVKDCEDLYERFHEPLKVIAEKLW